jgi:hypothetical protein
MKIIFLIVCPPFPLIEFFGIKNLLLNNGSPM